MAPEDREVLRVRARLPGDLVRHGDPRRQRNVPGKVAVLEQQRQRGDGAALREAAQHDLVLRDALVDLELDQRVDLVHGRLQSRLVLEPVDALRPVQRLDVEPAFTVSTTRRRFTARGECSPGIAIPPFSVMGIEGACGRIHCTFGSCAHSILATGSQP